MDDINSEKNSVIEAINKKKPELEPWLNRDIWKDYEKKDGYHSYYVDEESGLRSIKSEIVINTTMKEIFDYVVECNYKQNYDKLLDHCKQIIKFDDNYQLCYYNYKGKLLISNRDMYSAVYTKYDENESEIFCTNYVNLEKYPTVYKVERAELIYAGWKFKKVEGGIHALYYTLADMHLNQMLVNTTLGEVARQVIKLKEILEKK